MLVEEKDILLSQGLTLSYIRRRDVHFWGWILALHSLLPNYTWPLWRPQDLSFPYCVLFILEPVYCFQIVSWVAIILMICYRVYTGKDSGFFLSLCKLTNCTVLKYENLATANQAGSFHASLTPVL